MPLVDGPEGATLQQLVDQARHHLLGGMREKLNWTNGTATDSATDIVLADDVTGIKPGMLIEHGTELWYVRSVDTGASTVTVRRGMNSTIATPIEDDAEVRIDPHYPQADIADAIRDEIRALNGTGIALFEALEIEYSCSQQTYDLQIPSDTAELIGVYDVTYEAAEASGHHRPVRFRVHRHRDDDDFSAGVALEVLSGGYEGSPMRVIVQRTMTVPDSLSSVLDVPDYAVPVLAPGAAWRLLLGMEARRVNPKAEHGSRRAEEVPANANAFAARAFQSMRHDLVEQALEVQLRRYPPLFKD